MKLLVSLMFAVVAFASLSAFGETEQTLGDYAYCDVTVYRYNAFADSRRSETYYYTVVFDLTQPRRAFGDVVGEWARYVRDEFGDAAESAGCPPYRSSFEAQQAQRRVIQRKIRSGVTSIYYSWSPPVRF